MNEPAILTALAALLAPRMSGAEIDAATELCCDLPIDHPLAQLDLAMHGVCTQLYPRYAALCGRVAAGDDPEREEWIAAVDADRAEAFPPGPALALLFAEWEQLLAGDIASGVLHKGTVLAALMMLRDCVRRRDAALAEQLVPNACEAAQRPPSGSGESGVVILAGNGMIGCFIGGEQYPPLQALSAAGLWAARAESLGYDPAKFRFETTGGTFGLRKDDRGDWRFA